MAMMKLYGAEDHLLVLSDTIDADAHQHAFIQVTLALEGNCEMVVAGQAIRCSGIVIDANVVHQIQGTGQPLMLLLIDSTSDLAASFQRYLDSRLFLVFPPAMTKGVRAFVHKSHAGITDTNSYVAFLDELMTWLGVAHAKPAIADPRIAELVQQLRTCTDIEHSVSQYAGQLGLSSSRLSHLFKENTGISLGGYIVLHKLQKAVYLIFEGHSITDAAMTAGFDSPSHFAATAKRLLGMTAREIRKDSSFLKVSSLHES